MNQKGMYGALLAVLLMSIIAATYIQLKTSEQKIPSTMESPSLTEVKFAWENTKFVLDKVTAKSLIDGVKEASCNFPSEAEIQIRLMDDFEEVLVSPNGIFADSAIKCQRDESIDYPFTVAKTEISPTVREFSVLFDLNCSKNANIEGMNSAIKFDGTVLYEKRVSILNPTGCLVEVLDLQSNLVDYTTVALLCGNGAIDAGEECDESATPSIPPGTDCADYGFGGGTLTCSNCVIDTSSCVECVGDGDCAANEYCSGGTCISRCGNGTCEGAVGETYATCPQDCCEADCTAKDDSTCHSACDKKVAGCNIPSVIRADVDGKAVGVKICSIDGRAIINTPCEGRRTNCPFGMTCDPATVTCVE